MTASAKSHEVLLSLPRRTWLERASTIGCANCHSELPKTGQNGRDLRHSETQGIRLTEWASSTGRSWDREAVSGRVTGSIRAPRPSEAFIVRHGERTPPLTTSRRPTRACPDVHSIPLALPPPGPRALRRRSGSPGGDGP